MVGLAEWHLSRYTSQLWFPYTVGGWYFQCRWLTALKGNSKEKYKTPP